MAKTKFDIKSEATKGLYAGAGVADLVVETVREYVTDVQTRITGVQKSVTDIDLKPEALRKQAVTTVNARVDALTEDAKARRSAIEARVAELQNEALALPGKVQGTATATYTDLAKRGETLVTRIRRQESTKAATTSAKTTSAKAKTTKTQGTKAANTTAKKASTQTKTAAKKSTTATKTAAKKTTTAAKTGTKSTTATAKKASAPAQSSAKATGTAAAKTAENAAKATTEAAKKVGD
ncbi:hypothetical protein ABKW28_16720 [Nocardioides sp. 31GB23]|uniref:hypothetical protein n=1 Tax=Nocardioides sp. 31GB23 TaxID=3156065 RepID=UPI0032AF2DE3